MFETVVGIDFSGAKLAGRTAFLATTDVAPDGRLALRSLASLESLAGTAERSAVLAALVRHLAGLRRTLVGIDAPFGLPIEVIPDAASWDEQLAWIGTFADAITLGRACVERARALGGPLHIRRITDRSARTPFDCYHYRIVHQTFHAMRDVLAPLRGVPGTAILPFDRACEGIERVVVEACPGSTLRRLGLPYRGYKQPEGGAITKERALARAAILRGIAPYVDVPERLRRRVRADPGGDALDAILAAVGAQHGIVHGSPPSDDARIVREGWVYF